MPKRDYTVDTVTRALRAQTDRGVIEAYRWSTPEERFVVELFDYGHFVGTLDETFALIVGLRSSQCFDEHQAAKADTVAALALGFDATAGADVPRAHAPRRGRL